MATVYIYGLIADSSPDVIRYVGKTIKPLETRYNEHYRCARNGLKRPVYLWLRKLQQNGEESNIILLEVTNDDDWASRETHWIRYCRDELNFPLLNLSDGGESNLNYVPTLETCKKISDANKGRTCHWKGKKLSDAHKANIGLGGLGKKRTLETRVNISRSLIGKSLSEEHKSKISKAHMGKPASNVRAVEKLDLVTGEVLACYSSLDQAVQETPNVSKGNICTVARGGRKHAGGYAWRYQITTTSV